MRIDINGIFRPFDTKTGEITHMIIGETDNSSVISPGNINAGGIDTDKNTGSSRRKNNKRSDTIFAGALNINADRSRLIEQKRQLARKQAMKLIKNAWNNDKSRQGSIDELENTRNEKISKKSEYKDYINDIENRKNGLKEQYGITDDSQEQKDLELLEKYQNNVNFISHDDFSDDEIKRLKELQSTPLTDYQKKALSLNRIQGNFRSEIDNIDSSLMAISEAMLEEKKEQAKSQDMVKAGNTADKITQAVNDEIMGMLIAECKDKLDDDTKKAEEKKEEQIKKADEQDKLDKKKEEQKEQEDIIKGDNKTESLQQNMALKKQSDINISEAQAHIKKLIKENNIINEDIKGIEIDVNF